MVFFVSKQNTLSFLNADIFTNQVTTCSRRLIVKLCTLYRTQDPQNHTLIGGSYHFEPNNEVLSWQDAYHNGTISSLA